MSDAMTTRALPGFEARLRAAASTLGLVLTDTQCRQLLDFLAQMQRWNRTYNLTAVREPGQMLIQHVFDSLAVVVPLARELDGRRSSNTAPKLLDVGAGAGLPGIVLAIARPDWQVVCVDAVEKKTAFVRQMAAVLSLANLSACHARIESLAPQHCDIVISRAFASLADFAAWAGRHAAESAPLVAMKGQRPDDEIHALHAASDQPWRVCDADADVQILSVPELDAQRCLVWLRRQTRPWSSAQPQPQSSPQP